MPSACSSLQASDFVLFVNEYDLGLESLDFFIIHQTICANDQQVAQMGTASCSAIQGNFTTGSFPGNDVGGETLAIVYVIKFDSFKNRHAGGFDKIFINGAGSFISLVTLGDSRTMDFSA